MRCRALMERVTQHAERESVLRRKAVMAMIGKHEGSAELVLHNALVGWSQHLGHLRKKYERERRMTKHFACSQARVR